jgi:hypothetical protein
LQQITQLRLARVAHNPHKVRIQCFVLLHQPQAVVAVFILRHYLTQVVQVAAVVVMIQHQPARVLLALQTKVMQVATQQEQTVLLIVAAVVAVQMLLVVML